MEYARNLSKCLKFIWTVKTKKGFFLRAEDFINYTRKLSKIRLDMKNALDEVEDEYKDKSEYTKNLARLPYKTSLHELQEMYGGNLEENSHGESFFKLFTSRFIPGGLYILDEPETPLSPMNQFAFIAMIKSMVDQNSQFIIVTHSPIIMAYPDAKIYSFDNSTIKQVDYKELEHVKFMKAFLNNPENFIRFL